METGVEKAIRLAGGTQTALANLVGVEPQAVQKWVKQGYVPTGRCKQVKLALNHGVSLAELNPDTYGDLGCEVSSPSTHSRRITDRIT